MKQVATLLAICLALTAGSASAQSAIDRDRGMDRSTQYGPSGSGADMGTAGATQEDRALKTHFMAARTAYDNKDYQSAANHLREASTTLRSDAAQARGDAADDLRGAAKDLDKLADKVQRGELNNYEDVNKKVGDAYKATSEFHYQQARESFDRYKASGQPGGRNEETGRHLRAATQDLEDWAAVTGRKVRSGARTAMDTTRDLAGKMISGTGWATEQAGEAINSFGETIKDFGRDVENRDDSPQTTSPDASR